VARPELGTKRVCPTTGKKFYDLDRDPIVSPYTGESWPRSSFEPLVKGAVRPVEEDEEVEIDPAAAAAADFVPIEDADAEDTKAAPAADIDIDEDIGPAEDDDTFLEEEEEANDDVAGLIDGEIEGDEES
jgi:uncharacterized protein (TIGR02300 family)